MISHLNEIKNEIKFKRTIYTDILLNNKKEYLFFLHLDSG